MKEYPPTLMIRTDLLSNGDVRVSTPAAKYPAMVWERPQTFLVLQAHMAAAKSFALTIPGVDPNRLMKGTGPGHRQFMYHFAKVNR